MTTTKCQAGVKASLNCLEFDMGRLAVPQEKTLLSLLGRCFAAFTQIYSLEDPQEVLSKPSSLERMLCSTFDTASRVFVTETSPQVLAGLDDHDKSCLFVQAVAGMAMIFQRLNAVGQALSPSIFLRELQLFAESDQRGHMLEKIEASSLLNSCYHTGVMTDFVMAAIEDRETRHFEDLPLGRLGEDLLSDSVAWVSDRPCKTNGLPWGFTILAIN
ncbi:hypothetical protein B0T14DRAFT_500353 [Immersiella caudata]|uniref:Uncharacterized protein n=1 Tax=Immersiella caudata TaxID=314043 RepID=A0AA39WBY2_9PEZI|nr:hypothetical protein B0T14DRAFT_500353 [Immersiella caudata]